MKIYQERDYEKKSLKKTTDLIYIYIYIYANSKQSLKHFGFWF